MKGAITRKEVFDYLVDRHTECIEVIAWCKAHNHTTTLMKHEHDETMLKGAMDIVGNEGYTEEE